MSHSRQNSTASSVGGDESFQNRISKVRTADEITNEHGLSNKISTTKYTLLSWLPMSIAEQFRRFANIYFIIVVVMMYIGKYAPQIYSTPLLPESTAVTLFLVMMVTSSKEGLEDLQRAKFDHEENVRGCEIITFDAEGNEVVTVKETQNICSGDVVKLTGATQVPADMVLILTSNWDDGNRCFIETANLDGETNLKVREAPAQLLPTVEALQGRASRALFDGEVEFENPNKNMHNFVGALHLRELEQQHEQGVPLGKENVLLRGSLFSNTEWAYGVALYTGQECKVQMNNTLAPTKLGKVERYANVAVLIILGAQVALTTVSVISLYAMDFQHADTLPYVNVDGDMGISVLPLWLEYWFVFFLLYINFIPISLYVTMELTNIGQAYMMSNDLKMYDEDLDEACRVKSSSLVQEPGIVSNIFSDKTGTLTRNEMKLVSVVIKGRRFAVPRDQTPGKLAVEDSKLLHSSRTSMAFLRCLTTCHTVVRDKSGDYRAESPDEKALIEGMAPYGCSLVERGSSNMKCVVAGKSEEFDILAVNEFNSDRKRMSVLVKELGSGKIFLMCKGADSTMLKLVKSDVAAVADVQKSLLDLSHMGLRTLCVAHKELTQAEANAWLERYHTAASSMKGRAVKMACAAAEIERDMTLLGVTAIEDRLQDEVPEVIADLAKAGITLWMLTGDKEETAVQIGHSCNLVDPETELIVITKCENKAQFELRLGQAFSAAQDMYHDAEPCNGDTNRGPVDRRASAIQIQIDSLTLKMQCMMENLHAKSAEAINWFSRGTMNMNRENMRYLDGSRKVALVIDGPSLEFMDMKNTEQRQMLLQVGLVCRSVIGCRLTPIQKQQLVNIVKVDSKPSATTLAIGDGANDVSMIREAHVGVGIFGKEGRQAANNADFAIGQFKFLRRLTLVHGRWNYMRQSKVFLYSMHKNICMVISLFWFNYLAAMSGVSLYESWLYASYNIVLALPIIFFGFIDKDKSEEFMLDNPSMYGSGKQNIMLSKRRIFLWISNACMMGVVLCLLSFVALDATFEYYDFWTAGTFIFVALVNAMHAKMAFMHHQWNWINVFGMVLSVFGTIVVVLVLSVWGWEPLNMTENTYDFAGEWVLGRPEFWLYGFFMIPLVVVMVDFMSYTVRYMFFPSTEMRTKDMENKTIIEQDDSLLMDPMRQRLSTSSFSIGSRERFDSISGSSDNLVDLLGTHGSPLRKQGSFESEHGGVPAGMGSLGNSPGFGGGLGLDDGSGIPGTLSVPFPRAGDADYADAGDAADTLPPPPAMDRSA